MFFDGYLFDIIYFLLPKYHFPSVEDSQAAMCVLAKFLFAAFVWEHVSRLNCLELSFVMMNFFIPFDKNETKVAQLGFKSCLLLHLHFYIY